MTRTFTIHQTFEDHDGEPACIAPDCWPCDNLRDALQDLYRTRTAHVDGISWSDARYILHTGALVLTICNGPEFRTGIQETRMLSITRITAASAARLARLLNIRL